MYSILQYFTHQRRLNMMIYSLEALLACFTYLLTYLISCIVYENVKVSK